MSIINNGLLLASEAAAAGGYTVSRSLRFNAADSAFLSRVPGSSGNTRTWTLSFWIKRASFDQSSIYSTQYSSPSFGFDLRFSSSGNAIDILGHNQSGGNSFNLITTPVYRDPSAWMHVVLALDTTQATASNRVRLYVNGSEVTQFASASYPVQNDLTEVNSTEGQYIGCLHLNGSPQRFLNAYLAEMIMVDGQQLTPSSFAETNATTGQWVPKAYTGSYGTNGFRLTFSDNSGTTATTLGKDAAGSNNWTPNNFSVATGAGNDSLVDTPTSYGTGNSGGDVRGNYATLNPLDLAGGTAFSLANGNLEATFTNGGQTAIIVSTIFVSSGKWYAEFTPTTLGANSGTRIGVQKNVLPRTYLGGDAGNYAYQLNGNKQNNASSVAYGSSYTTNDVIGVALDMDAGTVTYYKNGVSQGQAYSGLSGEYTFAYTDFGNGAFVANFGQRPFAYTAPSGFKALVDTNLPTPTIARPSTVFDARLYTGNGSTQNITGLGFSPDLVWIKRRNLDRSHMVFDAVRGLPNRLATNETSGDNTDANNLVSFDSTGFTTSTGDAVNGSGGTYVAWAWDAGSSTVTNTQGSITSTVRANASAGFSVVTWTGTGTAGTIGHGLGAVPRLIITKRRNGSSSWRVYHANASATPQNGCLFLEGTQAFTTSTIFNNTAPTSTTFGVGTDPDVNTSGGTYVAYCFAPVTGLSAFGAYQGNGSTDGPAVWLGFRPRFIIMKDINSTNNWQMLDTARDTYNVAAARLFPNQSVVETSATTCFDFLSNGFKARNQFTTSESNITYIYGAWAESPFQYARAR